MDNKAYIKYKNKKYIWDINRFKHNILLALALCFLVVAFLYVSKDDYYTLILGL